MPRWTSACSILITCAPCCPPPIDGTSTVVVSNDFGLLKLTGVDLAFNEAAIVRSDRHGRIVVVARLDLQDLAEAARPRW